MEWHLYPLDVWFFRGIAPMNAGEAVVSESLFPPWPEVAQGFVRTALLSALGISLDAYGQAAREWARPSSPDIQRAFDIVGKGSENLGKLDIRGPYLIRQLASDTVERWFPAPMDLYRSHNDGPWQAEGPALDPVECDLGAVRLLPAGLREDRSAAGRWISEAGLAYYLRGDAVPSDDVRASETLYIPEPRVGIARNAATRTAREHMLYAPQFIRPQEGGVQDALTERVGLGLRVRGIDEGLQRACAGLQRLGGEGRLADVEVHQEPGPGPAPAPAPAAASRVLLLTPARWGRSWPSGTPQLGAEGWRTNLGGALVTLVSAAAGKPVRIGGWDMVAGRSKPAVACVPAGSVCYVRGDTAGSVVALHDQKIDDIPGSGFGHVLIGKWNDGGSP